MKAKQLFSILAGLLLLTGCSGGSTPLKDLAETYAEIADNNQELTESMQAVYKASGSEQQALSEKATSVAESVKAKNERLADKAASLGEQLQGLDIKCEASPALGVKVASATFTTVNAQDKLANIVITVEVEGMPDGTPYFFLMADKEVLYKSAARFYDGNKISINFRITTNNGSEMARAIAGTQSVMLVTQAEYTAGSVSDTAASAVNEASADGVRIEKGANLIAVLKAAKNVTYEYNADSGIWAHIGNVSIIIDEDQLNPRGTQFMSTVYSDIEPNLAFSPDYLKPDAKILSIEEN